MFHKKYIILNILMDTFYTINMFYNLIGIYIIRKILLKKNQNSFIVLEVHNCSCRYNTFSSL